MIISREQFDLHNLITHIDWWLSKSGKPSNINKICNCSSPEYDWWHCIFRYVWVLESMPSWKRANKSFISSFVMEVITMSVASLISRLEAWTWLFMYTRILRHVLVLDDLYSIWMHSHYSVSIWFLVFKALGVNRLTNASLRSEKSISDSAEILLRRFQNSSSKPDLET